MIRKLAIVALLATSSGAMAAPHKRPVDNDVLTTGSIVPRAETEAPVEALNGESGSLWTAPSFLIAKPCKGVACLRQFGSNGVGF